MSTRVAQVIFACSLGTVLTPAAPAQLSDKVRAEIVAPLPKFESSAADVSQLPVSPVGTPAPLSDDPLVVLPDYNVREIRVPDRDPDLWLSRRELERKAMSDYSDSMSGLEWALNSWYIPFVTPSPQARANAAYAANKIRGEHKRLISVAQVLAGTDSAEARRLLRDLDLSSHPGR